MTVKRNSVYSLRQIKKKINGDNKSKNANRSQDRAEEYATQIADISIGILSAVLKHN